MSKYVKASFLMIVSAMCFSAMQIVIARSAAHIPLFEQLFFRNLFAAIVAFIGVRRQKQCPFGKAENRKLLLLRSAAGYLGMVCLFYASAHAAQGDVAVMNKMSPFLVTLLAVVFLHEKITVHQVGAVVLAMMGAAIVANPTFHSEFFPIFVAFLSALFSGIAYTAVGALRSREKPCVIVFFFSFFSTVLTAGLMIPDFVVPLAEDLGMLVLIGLFALGGQMSLTKSYAMADASQVSIFNYSGILFSMLFGSIFLGQRIRMHSVAGAVLLVLAGLITVLGQARNHRGQNNRGKMHKNRG